mgnify:CR=1 FL=1|tara:strand:+ start:1463 stop:1627 length:165 start_codon:yes stop_codon:yes gene_type:complete
MSLRQDQNLPLILPLKEIDLVKRTWRVESEIKETIETKTKRQKEERIKEEERKR